MRYDPNPVYRLAGGEVEVGYAALAADLARTRPSVLAVDGPAALAWPDFLAGLQRALAASGISSRAVDVRDYLAPWEEVQRRTAASELPGDPVFARLFDGPLETLFDGLPRHPGRCGDLTIVFGPGSALMGHGRLWYVDLPKRFTLAAVQRGDAGNRGQPPGLPGSEQRHLFVDWPLLDRHRDRLASRLDRFVDLTRPERPRAVGGEALRRTLGELAAKPFRARPAFQPGSWGGQWLRRVLGVEPDAPNLAGRTS